MTFTAPLPLGIVMTSFEPGGTERQMSELVRRLDRARWTVHVACFHARGTWYGRVAECAASVTEFPVESFQRADALKHLWNFARWCRRTRLAVLHTTELYSNIFGLPGAALAGVPVRVGNRREINPDKSTAQIAMQRIAYSFAHKVVANSRAAADRLLLERVAARKVVVVPNGLDPHAFPVRASSAPPRRVIVVANLRPEKRHEDLIDAATSVLRAFPDARFDIVGGGPELDRLRARVETYRIGHAFSFLGHCDDVAARLAAADVFVLPSRSEAFPNAVLEAMAAGLPVIATAVGDILELIDEGRTGLLIPPASPAALSERLCEVMADPAFAASLGSAARAEVEARYSFDRMVGDFERLYLTELTRRGLVAVREPQLAPS